MRIWWYKCVMNGCWCMYVLLNGFWQVHVTTPNSILICKGCRSEGCSSSEYICLLYLILCIMSDLLRYVPVCACAFVRFRFANFLQLPPRDTAEFWHRVLHHADEAWQMLQKRMFMEKGCCIVKSDPYSASNFRRIKYSIKPAEMFLDSKIDFTSRFASINNGFW